MKRKAEWVDLYGKAVCDWFCQIQKAQEHDAFTLHQDSFNKDAALSKANTPLVRCNIEDANFFVLVTWDFETHIACDHKVGHLVRADPRLATGCRLGQSFF